MKKILIINSTPNNHRITLQIFEKMKSEKYELIFWINKNLKNDKNFKKPGHIIKYKKIFPLLEESQPNKRNVINNLQFTLLLPLFYLKCFFLLSFYKIFRKINSVILWGWNEKIVVSPISLILKINTIWLQLPNQHVLSKSKINKKIINVFSKKVSTICFSNRTKQELIKESFPEKKINTILPGIKLLSHERQSNIFDSLAQADHLKSGKKFFSLGTVLELDKNQKLEYLFQAIKNSQRIIPNIQLIVIGEGSERKSLIWLTKKMEIENNVWFIGRQKYTRKWLSGFDVYVNIKEKQNLDDITNILKAMSAGLPIIGPQNAGLDDILKDQKNCLLYNISDPEEIAGNIINLKQNFQLRKNLGKWAKEDHINFDFNKTYSQFIKII